MAATGSISETDKVTASVATSKPAFSYCWCSGRRGTGSPRRRSASRPGRGDLRELEVWSASPSASPRRPRWPPADAAITSPAQRPRRSGLGSRGADRPVARWALLGDTICASASAPETQSLRGARRSCRRPACSSGYRSRVRSCVDDLLEVADRRAPGSRRERPCARQRPYAAVLQGRVLAQQRLGVVEHALVADRLPQRVAGLRRTAWSLAASEAVSPSVRAGEKPP